MKSVKCSVFSVQWVLAMLLVMLVIACHAATTNDPGVQLTADQIAKLDNSVTSLLPLIPSKYQGSAAGCILLLVCAAKLGRAVVGWRQGGFFGALRAVFTGSVNALKILVCVLVPAMLLTGCAGTQVIDNTSGTGLNTSASVPIPYSGGQSLLMVKLTAGMWKNSAIVQPTATNKLYGPNVAINQFTRGSASTSAGAGTNGSAALVGASMDVNSIATGTAEMNTTNGGASLRSGD